LITADAGGSNGSRLRLWKWEGQRLSDELRIPLAVRHLPPRTSKWTKVEHRLFSFIGSNWGGEPLADHATVVNLISKATTTTGVLRLPPRGAFRVGHLCPIGQLEGSAVHFGHREQSDRQSERNEFMRMVEASG
jgi:hypothetical protein